MKLINKSVLKAWAIMIVIFLIIMVSMIFFMQKNMFFHPRHDEFSYNELKKIEEFEEIVVDNNGQKLYGWIMHNVESGEAPLLIYCGGNAQNSSSTAYRYYKNDLFKYFENYNVLMFDYPEYGLSEGKINDKTLLSSTLKIYDYAKDLDFVDETNIVVLGYSIGSGAATYLASQRDVNGLILVAPYDDTLSLYNDTLNIFYGPLKLLARYRITSKEYAKNVKVNPIIFTSYDDEVINYNFSVNLSKNFNNIDNLIILDDNVKHDYYFTKEIVLNGIHDYLQNRVTLRLFDNLT